VEHDAALACETAVAAGAAEHAPGPFADGETHQRPARAALARGEHDAAQELFRAAADAFRAAVIEAESWRARAQQAAEEARAAVEAALRADDLEATLQALARLAACAPGRADLAELLRHAAKQRERLTRAALDDARRFLAGGRLELAGQALDRLRRLAPSHPELAPLESDIERARKGEAERLARDAFDEARAKETEADGLAGRQSYAAATQAYQDAAQRYRLAGQQAAIRRQERAEADEARARMDAEKQRARPDAADFKAGLAEEQRGYEAFRLLAFKEAAGRFGAAQGLFAKAVAPDGQPHDRRNRGERRLRRGARAPAQRRRREHRRAHIERRRAGRHPAQTRVRPLGDLGDRNAALTTRARRVASASRQAGSVGDEICPRAFASFQIDEGMVAALGSRRSRDTDAPHGTGEALGSVGRAPRIPAVSLHLAGRFEGEGRR
jgi:hypothetical protein